MLMYLYELRDYFAPFNVFRYVSFRVVMAMITALLMSFMYPKFIGKLLERQVGQVVRDDGPQSHLKKRGTPTMGGSLILLSLVVSTVLWADLSNHYVWIFLAITTFFGGIGFIDDYLKIKEKGSRGLPGRWKLILQFAVTAVLMFVLFSDDTLNYSSQLYFPFVAADKFSLSLPVIAYALFAMVTIVGTSNAVNLTDGIDGLATGVTMPVMLFFARRRPSPTIPRLRRRTRNLCHFRPRFIPSNPPYIGHFRALHRVRCHRRQWYRVFVVQLLSRPSFHGRFGQSLARWCFGHARRFVEKRTLERHHLRALLARSRVGHYADDEF